MNTCVSKIRRFIASLPAGLPFSTQSCVQFGSRSAVDQSISQLIREKVLERLVRGVFVDAAKRKFFYSAEEIATIKLQAFGNEIVQTGSECAKERGLSGGSQGGVANGNSALNNESVNNASINNTSARNTSANNAADEQRYVFLTSGHSTRFRFGDDYIYLRKCNGRKIQLSDSHVGKTIRALWYLQQLASTLEIIYKQILTFRHNDFLELVRKARLMPAWLRDKISQAFSLRWQRTVYTQSIKPRVLTVIDSS